MNLAAAAVLSRGAGERSLNVEGSYRHILTDLYGFIATAVAAIVILATGFVRADAIASLLIAGLMLHAAYGLLKASGRVFLEAAPAGSRSRTRSAARSPRSPAWSRCTICTCGRSPRGSRRCPRTSWCARAATATRCAARSSACSRSASACDHTTLQVDHEAATAAAASDRGRAAAGAREHG